MPEGGIEQGGFVMDAPVGVWKNAFELDNSMEYPSAIITGNFGPDTKVIEADYPDGFHSLSPKREVVDFIVETRNQSWLVF